MSVICISLEYKLSLEKREELVFTVNCCMVKLILRSCRIVEGGRWLGCSSLPGRSTGAAEVRGCCLFKEWPANRSRVRNAIQ